MRRTFAVAALAMAVLAAGPVTSAGAAGGVTVTPVEFQGADLVGAFGIALGPGGRIYVADAFGGALVEIRNGKATTLAHGSVSDIALDGRGNLTALLGEFNDQVQVVLPNGKLRPLGGSTWDLENSQNPDQGNLYGFVDPLDPACADEMTEAGFGGILGGEPADVNSNPFGIAMLGDGSRLVADAGGNTLLRVTPNGTMTVAAVLPPVTSHVTAEALAQVEEEFGDIPDCVIGASYRSQPVPTGVAVGPDGAWYVSTLPGFPEEPGAGTIFRVNPTTGQATAWKTGFSGTVDLAFGPDGSLYVAELFASVAPGPPGAITKVATSMSGGQLVAGAATTVATGADGVFLPNGVAVSADGSLYVTVGALAEASGIVHVTF